MGVGKNYEAWNLQASLPEKLSAEECMRLCASYGTLAPSIHNTQPWKFSFEANTLTVTPDTAKQLPFADPSGRNLYISVGACVENIVAAAAAFGVNVDPIISSDEDATVCTLTFPQTDVLCTEDTKTALSCLEDRFSDKKPYVAKSAPKALYEELGSRKIGKATALPLEGEKSLTDAAELHADAARAYSHDKDFKKELTDHITFPRTKKFTGMPGHVMGFNALQVAVGKFILPRAPKVMEKVAAVDKKKIHSSAGVCFITAPNDTPRDWIEAGRLYENISLWLKAEGVHSTTLAAMIEVESIRTKAAKTFNIKGLPQMFLRFGYSEAPVTHTPRMPLEVHLND